MTSARVRALCPVSIPVSVPISRWIPIAVVIPMTTFIALAHDFLVRVVEVILTVNRALLILIMGIPVPRISPLIKRQGCRPRH